MKILVLGASGLIGSTMFRVLSEKSSLQVFGTIRSNTIRHYFPNALKNYLIDDVEANNFSSVIQTIMNIAPDVVINCIGATKHIKAGNSPIHAITINALYPHQLAQICQLTGPRLIHISTDCVFSGKTGHYLETSTPDADDVYGRSKALGEVNDGRALVLRTSTIGHELQTNYGLLNWFLSQNKNCKGYTKAVFSGLPTVVFAQIVRDYVLDNPSLTGLYHVAAQPINKYDLLKIIARVYQKEIDIQPDDRLMINRSLNASRFDQETGYTPPDWQELIKIMHAYQ